MSVPPVSAWAGVADLPPWPTGSHLAVARIEGVGSDYFSVTLDVDAGDYVLRHIIGATCVSQSRWEFLRDALAATATMIEEDL